MIEHMFYVPAYRYSVSNWNIDLKNEIIQTLNSSKLERDVQPSSTINPTYVLTDYEQVEYPRGPSYKEFILDILSDVFDQFSKEIKIPVEQLPVYAMWYEILEPYQQHVIHNHGPLGYTACFYIEFDSKVHESTKIYSPFNDFWTGYVLHWQQKVKEGDIIFFPACLMHEAPVNVSDKRRIVISFNIKL